MPTMHDVADQAGVSIATVSRVINGTQFVSSPVRERVLRAIEELGYQPNALARSLRKGQTCTIGLILPDSANPFFAEIGRSIELSAFSQGYNVMLCNTHGDCEKERHDIQLLKERRMDGIILNTAEVNLALLVEHLPKNLPLVMIDRDFRGNPFDIIVSDNIQGARLATKHLITSGHRRIACITGPLNLLSSVDRLEGYRQSLNECGIEVDERLFFYGNFDPESGYRGLYELMKIEAPPTAVFANNDMTAIGVLRAAAELDIHIPQELALVGFDDIELCKYTTPAITTVAQSKDEIGEAAVRRLIELMTGADEPGKRFLIPTSLIVRESTKFNGSNLDIRLMSRYNDVIT